MTLRDNLVAAFLGGAGALAICGGIYFLAEALLQNLPELPPALTDQQMSQEVEKCARLGLVLRVAPNKRYFDCWPPSVVQVK